MARSWPLGLAPGGTAPYPAEPDSATLRSRGAFAGLVWDDARRAPNTITRDIWCYGIEDPHVASSLRQRAANVACGSDVRCWQNRRAVSNCLSIAAAALTPEACRLAADRRKQRLQAVPKTGSKGS